MPDDVIIHVKPPDGETPRPRRGKSALISLVVLILLAAAGYFGHRYGVWQGMYDSVWLDPATARHYAALTAKTYNPLSPQKTAEEWQYYLWPWTYSKLPDGRLTPADEKAWLTGVKKASMLSTPSFVTNDTASQVHTDWRHVATATRSYVPYNHLRPFQAVRSVIHQNKGTIWMLEISRRYIDGNWNSNFYDVEVLTVKKSRDGWKVSSVDDMGGQGSAPQIFAKYRSDYVGGPFYYKPQK